ncbi:retrovirus-related pol polyprotein from transposon TNT 1-94 [Tanacetum coccineum]
MLSSTRVKPSTSASGSQPSGNTKKDKIHQTSSSTQKTKVEAHTWTIKSSLKNKTCVVEPNRTPNVQHSKLNANSELLCVKCNGCMLYDNHDLCVLDFINDVNTRAKSKSVKKSSKRKVWKPTGKVFTNIGYTWRPTGRTFTIVGNACPLTRITTTAEVPLRKPTALETDTPKPVVALVYARKANKSKTNVTISKPKIIKSISANKKEPSRPNCSLIGNVTISRVYYVEGLGHNLFFVGQFCDSNLEVAFRQHTCFIRNLEGVDLLTGSRGNNLYTLSLRDMMASSPISRHDLVRGLPKLKFEKDHLCSACAMGKRKKKPHKPKSKDTNQEKLYLLHMDLCGPMRVTSLNGKKYILVVVDDYSRFTWVKCLRSKDEAPDFIIKFLKMIQNLGKLQPKADIGIFISYAPTKKAFRIYNHRTRRILETIHVDFDELTAMTSEHSSLEPALHEITPATISSGLVPNPPPSTPFITPSRTDWDVLFQPLTESAASTGSPSSTTIDQDAPSPSNSQTTPETQSPVISNDVEEENHDLDIAHMNNDPFFGIPILKNVSEASSSSDNRFKLINSSNTISSICAYKVLLIPSDRTLTGLRTSLDDITKNIRMEYLPKRRWSTLEKKRANIMIKAIDKQLKERRLMRSLEKFVGGRHYGTDLRLLQRTI